MENIHNRVTRDLRFSRVNHRSQMVVGNQLLAGGCPVAEG